MSDEFFKTRMGHKFYEHDVPRIADALEKIGEALAATVKPAGDDRKFVEQVWLLREHGRGTTVFASEGSLRLHLMKQWAGWEAALGRLRHWDGQTSITVDGFFTLSVATVQL